MGGVVHVADMCPPHMPATHMRPQHLVQAVQTSARRKCVPLPALCDTQAHVKTTHTSGVKERRVSHLDGPEGAKASKLGQRQAQPLHAWCTERAAANNLRHLENAVAANGGVDAKPAGGAGSCTMVPLQAGAAAAPLLPATGCASCARGPCGTQLLNQHTHSPPASDDCACQGGEAGTLRRQGSGRHEAQAAAARPASNVPQQLSALTGRAPGHANGRRWATLHLPRRLCC